MKLDQADRDIKRSEDLEEGQFLIESSAEAFDILFDGLYSDKARAVVREIVCNAMDETADRMPDVHLPDHADPAFKCRDYGPGLSHQDVMIMYTTVFKSTKKTNNEKIGGFGLGSKAPFAYTDGFTVTSIHEENGVRTRRVYSMYRDEKRMPRPALMHEEVTTEPTGLEISVPVEKSDISSFADSLAYVVKHMPDSRRPNISGKYTAKTPTYTKHYGTFALGDRSSDEESYYARTRKAKVILGKIEYPITLSEEFYTVARGAGFYPDGLKAVNGIGPTLFMEIGEVALAPSREALSYSKATITALATRYNDIYKAMRDEVQQVVVSAPNPWEQALAFVKFLNDNDDHESLWSNTQFNGHFKALDTVVRGIRTTQNTAAVLITSELSRNGKDVTRKRHLAFVGASAFVSTIPHFVWLDPNGREATVRRYLKQLNASTRDHVIVLFSGKRSEAESILTSVGLPLETLQDASSLSVAKIPRVRSGIKQDFCESLEVFLPDVRHHAAASALWRPCDEHDGVDFEAGGFYVPTLRSRVVLGYTNGLPTLMEPQGLAKIRTAIESTATIIGVRSTRHKKFERAPQWVNFYTMAEQKIKNQITPQFLAARALVGEGSHETAAFYRLMVRHSIQCDTPTLLALHNQEHAVAASVKDVRRVEVLAAVLSLQLPELNRSTGLSWESLTAKFPMLSLVSTYDLDSHFLNVVNYMRLVGA
jgi:hypothetical protein